MSIIFEEDIRQANVQSVAGLMMIAARTAPKARGKDHLKIALADKETIVTISEEMRSIANESPNSPVAPSFLRDAANILSADALFLIGTTINPLGLADCGFCGFASCQEKNLHENVPCAFNTGDLGIALGSAVSVAMQHRMDNRIMYFVGKAVVRLGLLGNDVKICYGVPLSASGKNIFFDRQR